MKVSDILNEDGRIVKGVNTTVDVDVDEIPRQAEKFGNKVDKDGKPPTLSKKVKGKSTNVLFNLGLAENSIFEALEEKWSQKYKKSINCNNPKGFSQKAHCAGRKKTNEQNNPHVQKDDDNDIVMHCTFDNNGKKTCKKVKYKDIKNNLRRLMKTGEFVNGKYMDVYTDPTQAPKSRQLVTFSKKINGKLYKVWADQSTKKIVKKQPL